MHESGVSLVGVLNGNIPESARQIIRICRNDDFFAPVASGSSVPSDMIVLPCSMGTLGRIAGGMSTTLLERAADVVLKERKRMILCPREMPLNGIHLRNMTILNDMGALIMPPSPAFYQKPKTLEDAIDFVVGRVISTLSNPQTSIRVGTREWYNEEDLVPACTTSFEICNYLQCRLGISEDWCVPLRDLSSLLPLRSIL